MNDIREGNSKTSRVQPIFQWLEANGDKNS
jgi:hypothetical protein